MELKRGTRGRFSNNVPAECVSSGKHPDWGVVDKEQLISMKKIPIGDFNSLCLHANVTPTPHQRKNRTLFACSGCLRLVNTLPILNQMDDTETENISNAGTYQSQFESYVTNDNLANDNKHEETEYQHTGMITTVSTNDKSTQTETMHHVIDLDSSDIETNLKSLSSLHRQKLAYHLGKYEHENLLNQRLLNVNMTSYKNVSFLTNFDVEAYHTEQNKVVKSFLDGLSNGQSNTNKYRISKTIETIVDNCCINSVQPLHFLESLLLYSMTRSKGALQMLSAQTPYASYTTVQRWLSLLSSQVRVPRPVGDIIMVIDNNQIMKKKWTIKVDNKSYSSVVTMMVAYEMDKEGVLQEQPSLAPSSWRHSELSSDQINKLKHIDQDSDIKTTHYNDHLFPFITSRIEKVLREQLEQGDSWRDLVDDAVEQDIIASTYKICPDCEYKNSKSTRKCGSCSVSLSQAMKRKVPNTEPQLPKKPSREKRATASVAQGDDFKVLYDHPKLTRPEYDHISGCDSGETPNLVVLKPTMVNPNGYDQIQQVLLDIGKQSGIKQYCPDSKKEYVVVYCDGVPYNLIWRICRATVRCTECSELFSNKREAEMHKHMTFYNEFDWVLVMPGGGHLEMNIVKAVVDLLWPVFYMDMVMLFNFTSESALHSAKKVSDHHKGWALLSICRNALTDELLVPFVRQHLTKCILNDQDPEVNISAKDYFNFLETGDIKDPNYLFLVDISFEVIDSIFMFRAGLRSNRKDLIWAGRSKFTKVWCGRSHPAYRELNVHDLLQRMLMPDDLGNFIDQSMSLNMTGIDNTGEGPDFRLEEVNRGIQSFLPLAPKNEDWERVCLAFPTLGQLRQKVLTSKGHTPSSYFSVKPARASPREELAVRVMFRRQHYLDTPFQYKDHVSISGKPLGSELVHFCKESAKKHSAFVDDAVRHYMSGSKEKPSAVKCTKRIKPVCITQMEEKESAKLENSSRAELEERIDRTLSNIDDQECKGGWVELWEKTLKRNTIYSRSDYIEFLSELEDFVDLWNQCKLIDDNEEEDD